MVSELNAFSQSNGVDAIIIVNGKGMKVREDNGHMMQATHTKTAFYMKRVVLVRDPTDRHTTLKHLFERMLLTMLQRFWGNRLVTVAEDSQAKTRKALEALGFDMATVPTRLGGDLDWDVYTRRWLQQRFQIEESSGSPTQEVPSALTATKQPCSDTEVESADDIASKKRGREASKDADGKEHVPDEKLRETREKSAMYSRRSYYRKKEERMQLVDERDRLREESERLRREGTRLESLIEQAQAVVDRLLAQS